MQHTRYSLIGQVAWKGRRVLWRGTKVYVHHRYGVRIPSRRTVIVVAAGTTVLAGAIAISVQREHG